jgi:putative redox protein
VVTIGAPHGAEHVTRNFRASLREIEQDGEAQVELGNRQFLIKQQFLDDLDKHPVGDLGKLRKALLVMHSPLDATVAIEEAEKIYVAARHPKSFISLDDADHLLTYKRDSEYAAAAIAAWASRYLPDSDHAPGAPVEKGSVRVEEKDHKFAQHVSSDSHYWLADEPRSVGGANTGPDPYEHLLASLGACTSMTLRMYATHKKLALDHVVVELKHSRDYLEDCEGCEDKPMQIDVLERKLTLQGALSEQERARLLEIADRCPVHRTLHNHLQVRTELVDEPPVNQ